MVLVQIVVAFGFLDRLWFKVWIEMALMWVGFSSSDRKSISKIEVFLFF